MGFVCKLKKFCISSKVATAKRLKSKFVRGLVRKAIVAALAIVVIEVLEKHGVFLRIGKAADALIAAITDHVIFGMGGSVVDED